MYLHHLPEDVLQLIYKKVYSDSVVPCLQHKNWWWHTVKCRACSSITKYADAEYFAISPDELKCFSYGIGI